MSGAGKPVARLIEVRARAGVPGGARCAEEERSRGWRRRVARALIERFLLRGPMTCRGSRVRRRGRGDLARRRSSGRAPSRRAEGLIETFQKQRPPLVAPRSGHPRRAPGDFPHAKMTE